jgi:ABC-type transport system involved in cytochrome bd biosynthesis fused ATPase/permease subunit
MDGHPITHRTYAAFIYGSTVTPYLLIRAAEAKAVTITDQLEHGMEVIIPADLNEGRVVEHGSHADIVNDDGPYVRLVECQRQALIP